MDALIDSAGPLAKKIMDTSSTTTPKWRQVAPAQINLNMQFNRAKMAWMGKAMVGSPLPRSGIGGGFNSSPLSGREEKKLKA